MNNEEPLTEEINLVRPLVVVALAFGTMHFMTRRALRRAGKNAAASLQEQLVNDSE